MSDDEGRLSEEEEEMESQQDDEENEDDDEEEEEHTSLGPSALGLHRVGTKLPPRKPRTASKPMQPLNARGMPARMRKKNRFYDEDEAEVKSKAASSSPMKRGSPLKGLKRASTSKFADDEDDFPPLRVKKEKIDYNLVNFDVMSDDDIQVNTEQVGRRLKNLLKLPKAHKFVMFEWFYSNLDQTLFTGENEFQLCLRETFPQLAARSLARSEWTMIRRTMGKPRRCSQVRERLSLIVLFILFSAAASLNSNSNSNSHLF